MRRKIVKTCIIGLSMLMCLTASIGFAAYIISSNNEKNVSDVVGNDTNKLNKVVFKNTDGSVLETRYLPGNSKIDLSNLPILGDSRIQWKKDNSSGQVILDLCDKDVNKQSFTPTSDITLQATVVAPSTDISTGVTNNISGNTNPNNPNGNTTTVITPNKVTVKENPTIADKKQVCNEIEIGGSFENVNLDSSYRGELGGNKVGDCITNDLSASNGGDRINQANANNEITIGLEDPTAKPDMYRPFAGGSGNNYCVSRIKLNADLIIKNSTFNIGAKVGFYGQLFNWSQRNMQGFIIGNYSEVDLNGHNLIVGQGGHLNAYGSITNSVPGVGKVIINNGGTMIGTCVVEEHNCERAIPIQYYRGGELFSYIKMPYLNCDVKVNQGGLLKATVKMDFGGNNNNFADIVLNLIGNSNNCILQMVSGNGYIERKCSYDKNQYAVNENFSKQNLMHQQIIYEMHDIPDLRFNTANLTLHVVADFDIDLAKNGYIVPPYFSIYLYNTHIDIPMYVTFVPGSYLFVDEKSVINLSSSNFKKFSPPGLVGLNMSAQHYQTVGSLNFAMEKYKFNEAVKKPAQAKPGDANFAGDYGWVDDGETAHMGSGGGHMLIRLNSPNVHAYWNKNRKAHADILGKITFSNIVGYNNNSNKHELGGEINVSDVETLKNIVAGRDDVYMYATSAHFGPCYGGSTLGGQLTNITDYYIAPLISHGNVLMDPNNQGKIRNDYRQNKATYDKTTGITTYHNGDKYVFLHTNAAGNNWNGDITHVRKAMFKNENQYNGDKDSYYGKFFKINTINADKSVSTNLNANGKTNYIFFRGAFMPWDGTKVFIDKLRGGESDLWAGWEYRKDWYETKNSWHSDKCVPLGTQRTAKLINDSYYGYPLWKLAK